MIHESRVKARLGLVKSARDRHPACDVTVRQFCGSVEACEGPGSRRCPPDPGGTDTRVPMVLMPVLLQVMSDRLEPFDNGLQCAFERIGSWKVELDPGRPFDDARADLEYSVLDRVELSPGPLCASQALLPQRVHQHISGTVQEEPELVGLKPVTGGAV